MTRQVSERTDLERVSITSCGDSNSATSAHADANSLWWLSSRASRICRMLLIRTNTVMVVGIASYDSGKSATKKRRRNLQVNTP